MTNASTTRRLIALGRANAAIMIADNYRYHWYLSSMHYSFCDEGHFDFSCWTNTKAESQLLKDAIIANIADAQDVSIEKTDDQYRLSIKFEY